MTRKLSAFIAVAVCLVSALSVTVRGASARSGQAIATSRAAIDPAGYQTSTIAAWAERNAPDAFGGVWLRNGAVNVGFTRDAAQFQSQLLQVAAHPLRVVAVHVNRSWSALTNVQARIDRDTVALRAQGIDVTATAIRPQDNQVSVSVQNLNLAARTILEGRYGTANLEFSPGQYAQDANRVRTTPPWKGGIQLTGTCISKTGDCIAANCTANYTTFNFIQNVRFNYKLTAGHCFVPNTAVFNGVGIALGKVIQSFYSSGSSADVEDIIISPSTQTDRIITNDPSTQPTVTYDNQQATGLSVCKSGITTNETCGWNVFAIHATVDICDNPPSCTIIVSLVDQVIASNSPGSVDFGDSGGPVYRYVSGGVEAEGITSALSGLGDTLYYTFFQNELNVLHQFPCLSPEC